MPTPVHPPGGTPAGPGPNGGPGPVAVNPPGGVHRRKKGGHHGVLGLAQNLGSDTYGAIAGIGPGLVAAGEATAHDVVKFAKHPVSYNPKRDSELRKKVVGPLVKTYKQTYGPLTHGDVNKFLHNVYDHPLGPVLDLATIATLGGAGAVKVGKVAADVGVISKESRLAHLGDLQQETLRTPEGLTKELKGRTYSRNPVIRARQKVLQRTLDRLPDHFSHYGATARYARELKRAPMKERLRLEKQSVEYNKAFRKLSLEEQAALHLSGRGVSPAKYAEFLRRQEGHVEPTMLKVLQNPKVVELYDHPTPALVRAHAEADKLTKLDAKLKGYDASFQAEVVDRHAHAVHGDTVPDHPAGLGRFYVPDRLSHERLPNARGENLGGGTGVPKTPQGMKQNKLTLFRTGRLALHGNLIGREYLSTLKYGLHGDLHDQLMASATKLSKQEIRDGAGLPTGMEFIRRSAREKISPLARQSGSMKRQLSELAPKADEAPKFGTETASEAQTLHGDYLIVPKKLTKELNGEFRRSGTAVRVLLEKPTTFWRAIILGYRVGFLTNNVIGNHLLLAAKLGGINFAKAYLHTLKDSKLVAKLIHTAPDAWRQELIDEFLPEQTQTFGLTQGKDIFRSPKANRAMRAAGGGIMPATQNIAETQLRKIALETVLRGTPEVKRLMRAMPRQTRSWKAATVSALKENPALEREISQKINDALGDYTSLSPFERGALRNVVPFYAWYKVIFTVTGKLAMDNPLRANILVKLGQIGNDFDQQRLGDTPDFLKHLVPFGKTKGGKHTVLSTQGLNPWETIAQAGPGVTGLLTGKPGEVGKAITSVGPNPFLLAAIQSISGKDLFTGRDIKHGRGLPEQVLAQVGGSLPPTALVQAARGKGHTSKSFGRETFLKALLGQSGAPFKSLDLAKSHEYANR